MTDISHDRRQLERLSFFSDAVFAIAITLLVIEVRLPEVEMVDRIGLGTVLVQLIPKYIGFVVSFAVIGRFWFGHYRTFGLLARADDGLVERNLLFMLTIAFGPFPTAVVSNYLSTSAGAGLYAGWLVATGLLNANLVHYALRGPLLDPAAAAVSVDRFRRASWSSLVVGILALGAAAIRPFYALVPLLASPLIVWAVQWRPKRRALPRD